MTSRFGSATVNEVMFGYNSSGTFRCAYGNEKPLLILTAVISFLVIAAIYSGLFFVNVTLIGGESAMFFAIATVCALCIWVCVCLTVMNFILHGKEYSYHADEQKITIYGDGKNVDFFYMNVISVSYDPLMFLGRQRGFLITVLTRKGTYRIKYVFLRNDVRKSPELTPFHIIEERQKILFDKEQEEKAPKKPAVVSEMEEISPMPSRIGSLTEDVAELEAMPEVKLSPTITKPQHTVSDVYERPYYRSGRNEIINVKTMSDPSKELISKGQFRTPHKYEIFIWGAFIIVLTIVMAEAFIDMVDGLTSMGTGGGIFLIIGLIWLIAGIAIYRVAHYTIYSYEADSNEFRIFRKNYSETIYYCDVLKVSYAPLLLLWKQRGYKVSIVTKYKTITYNYLFLQNRKRQEPKETPFHIIEQQLDE